MAEVRDIEYQPDGLHVPGTPLWLDARRPRELSFISHAHAHAAPSARLVCTDATQRLLRLTRHGLDGTRALGLTAAYHQPFTLGALSLEMFPAGHVLGAAQLRVVRGGERLVYTGDLLLAPTGVGPTGEIAQCDALVLDATYGQPRFVFPPRAELLAAVDRFVDRALRDGATPVLLAASLGKAQELMRRFAGRGLTLRAHKESIANARVYKECGVDVPAVKVLRGKTPRGAVVVWPPNLARSPLLAALEKPRLCLLSGWALDPATRASSSVDAALPLSDHAGFDDLCRYAQECGASRVYTLHGHAVDLARELRARGLDARPLQPASQLELFA